MAKDRYEDMVLPRLQEIKTWIREGYFEKDIIKLLGIGKTSWEKYKNEHSELAELIKKSKQECFKDLEPIAIKSLKKLIEGFHEFETERITKTTKKGTVTTEKAVSRYYKPDTTMIIYILKVINNYKWNDNKEMLELKQKQLDLAKEKADKDF